MHDFERMQMEADARGKSEASSGLPGGVPSYVPRKTRMAWFR
jgi:hypothetical protein